MMMIHLTCSSRIFGVGLQTDAAAKTNAVVATVNVVKEIKTSYVVIEAVFISMFV